MSLIMHVGRLAVVGFAKAEPTCFKRTDAHLDAVLDQLGGLQYKQHQRDEQQLPARMERLLLGRDGLLPNRGLLARPDEGFEGEPPRVYEGHLRHIRGRRRPADTLSHDAGYYYVAARKGLGKGSLRDRT